MKMLDANEFIESCQVFLVHGSAGSTDQKEAHNRLLLFQQHPNAWQITLQVLIASVDNKQTIPDSARFISAQIIRHAVPNLNENDQIQARDGLLQYLQGSKAFAHRNVSPVERLVCLGIASAVVNVKRHWSTWKDLLQHVLLDDRGSVLGLQLILEVLSGIPGEIYSACSTITLNNLDPTIVREMIHSFDGQKSHVLQLVQETLRSAPDAAFVALTTLQNWGRDTMPLEGIEFGFQCLDLHSGNTFGALLDLVVSPKAELSQLATEIVCDAFAQTNYVASTSLEQHRKEGQLALELAKYILSTETRLQETLAGIKLSHPNDEIDEDEPALVVARNLAKIASTIACGDSHFLFAGSWCKEFRIAEGCSDTFEHEFLRYLVLCTSYPVASIVEPVLEFWYTILELNRRWKDIPGISQSDASCFIHSVLPTLQQVVASLLMQCQFPLHFIQQNQLQSDHSQVDTIRELRREICDALLNLFSNWPSASTNSFDGSYACLENIIQMMLSSQEIQQLDSLLYVLDYMVELIDLDELDPTDSMYVSVRQLWQKAIQDFGRFPDHALLLHGTSRLISSLVIPLEFEPVYYVAMTSVLVKGLKYKSVATMSAKSILKMSNALSQRQVGLSVRGDSIKCILDAVAQDIVQRTLNDNATAHGDVLEALLRLGQNFSDSDYIQLINCALPRLVASLQSTTTTTNPQDVATLLYLLSRGLRGIQTHALRNAFLVQEWSVLFPIVSHHGVHPKVRENAVELFVSVLPSCTHFETIGAIIQLCLGWHDQFPTPFALKCIGVLAQVAATQPSLQPHVVECLDASFRSVCQKFHFDSSLPSNQLRSQLLERFQTPPEDLAQEAVQFYLMMREILRVTPQLLCCQSQILFQVLKFSCEVVAVDHKLPDVTDAICSFFSDVLSLDHEFAVPVAGMLQHIAYSWVESLLIFIAMSTISSKTRCVSNVFHQSLHAGNTDSQLRGMFGTALQHVIVTKQLFQPQLSAADSLLLTQTMLGIKDKRKFQVFLNTTSMYLQGYGPPPWTTPILLSPRSHSSLDILH